MYIHPKDAERDLARKDGVEKRACVMGMGPVEGWKHERTDRGMHTPAHLQTGAVYEEWIFSVLLDCSAHF